MLKIRMQGDFKKSLEKEFKKETERQVKEVKESLKIELKNATPVDTGKAREGWYTTETSIENDVEYIDSLNKGTSNQAPSFFIERTLLNHEGVKPSGIIVSSK